MKLTRQQWIKFRAEQLAYRAEWPGTGTGDQGTMSWHHQNRARAFGTPAYAAADQVFRAFLQPYIDEARAAYQAEQTAAFYFSAQPTGWKVPATDPFKGGTYVAAVTADEDDYDEDEIPVCQLCGQELSNDEDGKCEDCEQEDE